MSRSRNRPAEPQRKPSAKVTLEDVMRSMQDLVHNELADSTPTPADQTAPNPALGGLKARKLPKKAAGSQKGGDRDTEKMVEALKSLVAEVRAEDALETEAIESEELALTRPETDPDGQLYLNLDSAPEPDSALSLTAEDLKKADIQRRMEQTLDNSNRDYDDLDHDSSGAAGDASALGDTDGIPVLRQVVPADDATQEPVKEEDIKNVAVRVIARLNIERRKSGQEGLDAKTIHRLQNLLSQELEEKAPNMDNTAQD